MGACAAVRVLFQGSLSFQVLAQRATAKQRIKPYTKRRGARTKVAELLKRADADVVALEEVLSTCASRRRSFFFFRTQTTPAAFREHFLVDFGTALCRLMPEARSLRETTRACAGIGGSRGHSYGV